MLNTIEQIPDSYVIDYEDEKDDLIPGSSLPLELPPGRDGRPISNATGQRFFLHGRQAVDGAVVKMPGIMIGGIRYTSRRAIRWWIARLNGTTAREQAKDATRSHELAEIEAEALGV